MIMIVDDDGVLVVLQLRPCLAYPRDVAQGVRYWSILPRTDLIKEGVMWWSIECCTRCVKIVDLAEEIR